MNIAIENKKQKAIELMNRLGIYKPYIKCFKDKNSVPFTFDIKFCDHRIVPIYLSFHSK